MHTEIWNVVKYVCVFIFVSVLQSHPQKKFVITGKSINMLCMEKGGGKVTGICDFVSCFCFLNNGGQQEREINEIWSERGSWKKSQADGAAVLRWPLAPVMGSEHPHISSGNFFNMMKRIQFVIWIIVLRGLRKTSGEFWVEKKEEK